MKKSFSLLWPDGKETKTFELEEQVIKDLELENLVSFMIPDRISVRNYSESIERVIFNPSSDAKTIDYRLQISSDLLRHSVLYEAFEELLPIIEKLSHYRSGKHDRASGESPLYSLIFRLRELENYIKCIDTLKSAFDQVKSEKGGEPLGKAMEHLYRVVNEIDKEEKFSNMRKTLPELTAKINETKSISIGINLDKDLRPIEASLVSINDVAYSGKSGGLFSSLFKSEDDSVEGLAKLYSKENQYLDKFFNDLSDVLKKSCESVRRALNHYIDINTEFFTGILEEMTFFICGVAMLKEIEENGLSVCSPKVANPKKRVTVINDNYNINLYIRMFQNGEKVAANLIKNDVSLGVDGDIAILTGPNQGGKTVFTQGVGLSHVMFQAGLCIPGTGGEISPADKIFTHFQIEEHISKERGRFADEAKRFHDCIEQSSSRTLILMNESFASTNYSESLYIAVDLMKIFRIMGVRTIFATHFHDLALQVEDINSDIDGIGKLFSLVSVVEVKSSDSAKRTFRIVPGPPEGKSYAREIALKYGIGFEQLKKRIKPGEA